MLRCREQRGPLSLSHYPVTLLCFHWQSRGPHRSVLRGPRNATLAESNPGRSSDDGEGRRGEENMKDWEEVEERDGADVGARWGKEISNVIHLLFCKNFV